MPDPQDRTKPNINSADSVNETANFEVGQILAGKYKVISLLGAGGMGSVYRVEQIFLKQNFALKTLSSGKASDLSVRRFQLEARAASLLNHPNLVKVTDFGVLEDDHPYLVMDFVDGDTIAELLKKNGPLTVEQAGTYFTQACLGLSYAHEQGVIHRDIKPSNLMIATNLPFGAEGSVKVVDFGIAKLAASENGEHQALTTTGEIFGSPLYMSPEQCSGALVDHRSDIYSLGCVLFEALTGTAPHVGQNAIQTLILHQTERVPTLKEASLGKEFPETLEQLVAKMLAREPANRYQSLGIVANDLAQVLKGAGLVSDAATKRRTDEKTVSMSPRKFGFCMAGAGISCALIAGFVSYNLGFQAASSNAKAVAERLEDDKRTEAKAKVKTEIVHDEGHVVGKALEATTRQIETEGIRKANRDKFKEEFYGIMLTLSKAKDSDKRTFAKANQKLKDLLKQIDADEENREALHKDIYFGVQEKIAFTYVKMGEMKQAELWLNKIAKQAKKFSEWCAISDIDHQISNYYFAKQDWNNAENHWETTAKYMEKVANLPDTTPENRIVFLYREAEGYRGLAAVSHQFKHDFDDVIKYGLQAKSIYEKLDKTNTLQYALNSLFLSDGLIIKKRSGEAKPLLLKALPILKKEAKISAGFPRLYANACTDLANIEKEAGNIPAAKNYFKLAENEIMNSRFNIKAEKEADQNALRNIRDMAKALGP